MTLHYFKTLSQDQQQYIVIKEAIYLTERKHKAFTVVLYQMDNFYVEFFSTKNDNSIKRIKSFKSTNHLTPYLEAIDLSNLL